jgi:hypothetical protein
VNGGLGLEYQSGLNWLGVPSYQVSILALKRSQDGFPGARTQPISFYPLKTPAELRGCCAQEEDLTETGKSGNTEPAMLEERQKGPKIW